MEYNFPEKERKWCYSRETDMLLKNIVTKIVVKKSFCKKKMIYLVYNTIYYSIEGIYGFIDSWCLQEIGMLPVSVECFHPS